MTAYVDRERGEVVEERVFGGSALNVLYEDRRVRWLTDHVLTRRSTNRLYGLWQRSPRSKQRIPEFVAKLGIDATEAELPLSAYPNLDAFFTRRLREGVRPVDPDPARLVSPCDARVLAYAAIDGEALPVKGSRVTVAQLVGDAEVAAPLAGGAVLVARLAPADYHWFHFPADGVASDTREIDGRLHSVHPIALGAGARSFENYRTVSTLDTERFGRLVLVEVGALLVGTIEQHYAPGSVTRGAAKGLFRFGGSTVVLLAEPGALTWDADLLANTGNGFETLVRMGTGIAT
ncbi:MAG: phosphatidylserine decarboxylase [Deltaproteobacteria bacterium]|nr:MAG: phosphatidylserine decarboxylase [Deltaproteobacteria bacterium]